MFKSVKSSLLAAVVMSVALSPAWAATARFGGGSSVGVSRSAPAPRPSYTPSPAPSAPRAPSYADSNRGGYAAPSRPTVAPQPSQAGSVAAGAVVGGLLGLAAGSALASGSNNPPQAAPAPQPAPQIVQPTQPQAVSAPGLPQPASTGGSGLALAALILVISALAGAAVFYYANLPARPRKIGPDDHLVPETSKADTDTPPFDLVGQFMKIQTLHAQRDGEGLKGLVTPNMYSEIQSGEPVPMGINSVSAILVGQYPRLITVEYRFKDATSDHPTEYITETWHWAKSELFGEWLLDGIQQA